MACSVWNATICAVVPKTPWNLGSDNKQDKQEISTLSHAWKQVLNIHLNFDIFKQANIRFKDFRYIYVHYVYEIAYYKVIATEIAQLPCLTPFKSSTSQNKNSVQGQHTMHPRLTHTEIPYDYLIYPHQWVSTSITLIYVITSSRKVHERICLPLLCPGTSPALLRRSNAVSSAAL